MTNRYPHLNLFEAKMAAEQLGGMVIETFKHYYREVVEGATGLIPGDTIRPPTGDEVLVAGELKPFAEDGRRALPHAVRITLNGVLDRLLKDGCRYALNPSSDMSSVAPRLSELQIRA